MAYSCTDFTDDVLNKLVDAGLIQAEDVPDDDPETQGQLAVAAIDTLLERIQDLTNVVRLAAAPGGISENEFSRPGGWREKALGLINLEGQVLHLFYVSADDDNGNNVDLITRAPDAETAIGHWRTYFAENSLPTEPEWVGIVPTARTEGPIPWNDIQTLRGKADAE